MKEKHTEIIVERPPWDTGGSAKDDPYTRLAVAVVMKAVEDYIEILKMFLKGNLTDTEIHDYKVEKRRLEQFFHSKYYALYTAFLNTEIDLKRSVKRKRMKQRKPLKRLRKKKRKTPLKRKLRRMYRNKR